MTVLDIARKDFADAIRSRAIWFAVATFTALVLIGVAIPVFAVEDVEPSTLVTYLQSPATGLILPILAVMLGYRSIVGERERGSVKFLLALPHSRRDVVVGKILGRAAVLAVALLFGFLVATVAITIVAGVPPLDRVAAFALVSVLGGTAIVAISVGVSAATRTSTRAITILVGGYVLATSLWTRISSVLHYLLIGEFPGSDPPWWVHLANQLNPIEAYSTAGTLVLPEASSIHVSAGDSGLAADQGAAVTLPETAFHDLTFVLPVLAGWIALPLVVGYLRFRAADLA